MILDELFQLLAGVAYCPKCLCPRSSSSSACPVPSGQGWAVTPVPEQQVTSQGPSAGLLPPPAESPLCSVLTLHRSPKGQSDFSLHLLLGLTWMYVKAYGAFNRQKDKTFPGT